MSEETKTEIATSKDLVAIGTRPPSEVFTPDGITPFLDEIKKLAENFEADPSTPKGRQEAISYSRKFSTTKTTMKAIKKDLCEDLVKTKKVYDKAWGQFEKACDEGRDLTRKAVTDWEQQDQKRIDAHEARIVGLLNACKLADDNGLPFSVEMLRSRLETLENAEDYSWQEFEARATRQLASSINTLKSRIAEIEALEKQEAELARLRKEDEERKQKDRDELIRKEAEAKAKAEAERIAAEEAQKKEDQRLAEIKKADDEKEELRLKIEKIESDRLAAEEKIIADLKERARQEDARQKQAAIDEENREKETKAREAAAKAKAEKEKEEAIEAERQRVQAESDKVIADAAKREANISHRKRINNDALNALVKFCELSEEDAKSVVACIAMGEIPNVKIGY